MILDGRKIYRPFSSDDPKFIHMSTRNTKAYDTLKLLIKDSKGFYLISYSEIQYVKAERAYSSIQLIHPEPLLCAKPLVAIEELIRHEAFFRCHSSYLVNLHMIKAYNKKDGSYLYLNSGQKIPLAQNRKENLLIQLERLFLI